MSIDWEFARGVLELFILPALVWLWQQDRRIGGAEREILRLLTMLEEREKTRLSLREMETDAIERLQASIESLHQRLDDLGKIIARMQGENSHRSEH